jgi:hypothetical protein
MLLSICDADVLLSLSNLNIIVLVNLVKISIKMDANVGSVSGNTEGTTF